SQTQGTPGTGVTLFRQFAGIRLAAGVNGQNNNFGEAMPPIGGFAVLQGIHHQPSVITLALTGPVDPVQARNPWNYSIYGLTNQSGPQWIAGVSYNATTHVVTILPAQHLNIHDLFLLTARFPAYACWPAS